MLWLVVVSSGGGVGELSTNVIALLAINEELLTFSFLILPSRCCVDRCHSFRSKLAVVFPTIMKILTMYEK